MNRLGPVNRLGALWRTAVHLRPGQIAWRLWHRARRPLLTSRLYHAGLGRHPVAHLARPFPELWPGDAANGRCILAGTVHLLGQDAALAPPVDWQAAQRSHLWRFTLQYFDWLDDLAATDDADAPSVARALIGDWLRRCARPDVLAWHAYPLSLRLVAWLRNAPWVLDGAEDGFKDAFLSALDAQARHLPRVIERDVGGNHLIKNLKALIAAGRCLPGHEAQLAPALAELEGEVGRQILDDGCHYERSPSYHLQVLGDLIDLDALLGAEAPAWLPATIARMAPALAMLRHGDGGLALFNDATVEDTVRVDRALALAGDPAPSEDLPAAGYYRLAAGGTTVLFDAGRVCPDDLPGHGHADTLSLEVSHGGRRLIVNCGTYAYQDPAWRNRLRGTAAHSTVEVDGTDSAEVWGAFRVGRRPRAVRGWRDGLLAEGRHDGYAHLGVEHARRLVLTPDGRTLAGSDVLSRTRIERGRHSAVARFHLHPSVQAAPDGVGGGIRLTDGAGGRWRFTAEGARLAIEPSVYAPRFYEMSETRCIALTADMSGDMLRFTWRLHRI